LVKHRSRKLLVEGAGDRADLSAQCRKGFQRLFEKAGLGGVLPRVVPCGSRSAAFDKFCSEFARCGPNDVVMLLVDSEAPCNGDDSWEHVKQREGDRWEQPAGATADHLHLMVQVMESWFLADPDTLERYFGKNFRREALPDRTDIESIAKLEVYRRLQAATKDTKSGPYGKGTHSFKLLAELDPNKLQAASPSARRLFDALRQAAAAP
jgi:hypothetical protein